MCSSPCVHYVTWTFVDKKPFALCGLCAATCISIFTSLLSYGWCYWVKCRRHRLQKGRTCPFINNLWRCGQKTSGTSAIVIWSSRVEWSSDTAIAIDFRVDDHKSKGFTKPVQIQRTLSNKVGATFRFHCDLPHREGRANLTVQKDDQKTVVMMVKRGTIRARQAPRPV